MRVEILLEVTFPRDPHFFLELRKVLSDRYFSLGKLPSHAIVTIYSLDHVVVVVNFQKPQCNLPIVWCIGVLKGVYVVHDLFNLLHALRWTYPQLALGILQALSLDVFDLSYGVVSLFSPFKFFVKEVQHGEVKTPEVITAGQVDAEMGMQRSKGDCAPEISALSFGHRIVVAVKMLLGKTEVHYIDLTVFLVHHKIRSLNVPMNKTTFMDAVDSSSHLH